MAVYDIRPARPSDINGILGFQRAAIAAVPVKFYAGPAKAAWLKTPAQGLADLIAAQRYFVAVNDDVPVGGAGWEPYDAAPAAAALRGVFVHPDCGGAGLGKRLVLAAEDAATTSGFSLLFVPASLNATGFYERLGYRKERKAEIALHGTRVAYCRMWKDVA
jgi:N-acetylglutamate synthase-like GNAT family acetyltransferase